MKHSEINWAPFVAFLKRQVGKPYVFGVENDPNESNWDNYREWDCSELVEIAFYKIRISVPDGSYNQAKVCKEVKGTELLIGDLGFKWNPDTKVIHHVGLYVGDNTIVEAKGERWGVTSTPISAFMGSTHFAYFGRLKTIEDA